MKVRATVRSKSRKKKSKQETRVSNEKRQKKQRETARLGPKKHSKNYDRSCIELNPKNTRNLA